MANHSGLADHCIELLSTLGTARARRMFGGHGLYIDDLFVGLISSRERLYLKADAGSRARFEAAGCEPFQYERGGELRTMPGWWTAPAEAMESPALMEPWARLALKAALEARAQAPAAKKKPAGAFKRRAAAKARRAAAPKSR